MKINYLLLATHLLFCIPTLASDNIQSHDCINYNRSWFDTEIKKFETEFLSLSIPKRSTNTPTDKYISAFQRILDQRRTNLAAQQCIINIGKKHKILKCYETNALEQDIASKKICDDALAKALASLKPKDMLIKK